MAESQTLIEEVQTARRNRRRRWWLVLIGTPIVGAVVGFTATTLPVAAVLGGVGVILLVEIGVFLYMKRKDENR